MVEISKTAHGLFVRRLSTFVANPALVVDYSYLPFDHFVHSVDFVLCIKMAVPVEIDIDALLDTTTDQSLLPLATDTTTNMTSSTPLTSGPLEGFVKLNDKVHVYTPTEKPEPESNDPHFLLMCSWAFAQPRHISKYIKSYQSLYPRMQILLVQVEINNMVRYPRLPKLKNVTGSQPV